MKCAVCDDCGWVCENHPDRPFQGERACTCGGAGAPCPRCNESDEDTKPQAPEGIRAPAKQTGPLFTRRFNDASRGNFVHGTTSSSIAQLRAYSRPACRRDQPDLLGRPFRDVPFEPRPDGHPDGGRVQEGQNGSYPGIDDLWG